jgi:PIN domain nuclease of toxin-antitoxin system
LDTSAFLWLVGAREKLNTTALKLLESQDSELFLSVISVLEIVIKVRAEKLSLESPPTEYFSKWQAIFNLQSLHIGQEHSLEVWNLPALHQDPFDRMLVAQARTENMTLLTTDRVITRYPVRTLWCGK